MTRWESRLFNTLAVVTSVTGTGYFLMKYTMSADDPFALVNHPWQPSFLAIHIVVAALLMAAFGMVFRSHAFVKLRAGMANNRRTGCVSLVGFGLMAISGYLIQVMQTPELVEVFTWVHWATSGAFVLGFAAHFVIGWRLRRATLRRARRIREAGAGRAAEGTG